MILNFVNLCIKDSIGYCCCFGKVSGIEAEGMQLLLTESCLVFFPCEENMVVNGGVDERCVCLQEALLMKETSPTNN